MEFSEWEVQRRDIDKIFEWMKRTVCHSYLKTCVHVTHSWKEAYNNLKTQVGQGSREIQRRIRDDYNQHMKPFRGTPRDLEAWLIKWEEIMLQGKKKSMFLEAIRPLDEAWVTSFEHSIDPKIDDKSLTYKDLSNGFRRLIPRLRTKRQSRIIKGSFATHLSKSDDSEEENEESLQRGRAVERGRRRSRSQSFEGGQRSGFAPDKRGGPKPTCPACGGMHFIDFCFYIFGYKAPQEFEPRLWLQQRADRWLNSNAPLAKENRDKLLLKGKNDLALEVDPKSDENL
ncbi:hypothetical protein TSTA_052440 [Talaromyces stipitatus ATCC 10500]|uniref:Uncharacterized protein n=1 Tax=Talaromyces stipitatus (strain ATCC 10500 / CBS 375.48 / QM 6759 / NRRL 1006) TaxID=441959 RepID=B8MQS4_TALSN|nr:uncharacterized protein TSTA_052440 [Talaromyces stipitatus ATCC 10500]EED12721.1 hypothetical protein TSTA_052440 [Talaromyces stipitatus ATCC 10500]